MTGLTEDPFGYVMCKCFFSVLFSRKLTLNTIFHYLNERQCDVMSDLIHTGHSYFMTIMLMIVELVVVVNVCCEKLPA